MGCRAVATGRCARPPDTSPPALWGHRWHGNQGTASPPGRGVVMASALQSKGERRSGCACCCPGSPVRSRAARANHGAALSGLSPYRRQRRALAPAPLWSPSAPSDHGRCTCACRHRIPHGPEAYQSPSPVSAEQRRVVLEPCATSSVMPSCAVGSAKSYVTPVGGIPKKGLGRTSGATDTYDERACPDRNYPPFECPCFQSAPGCEKPFRLSADRWNSTSNVSR